MSSEDTCIHTANGEIDAQQVRAFLEAHGIPCEFHGEALRNTHGLTLDGLGRVEIHVTPERVEEARDLLARAEAGELALDESLAADADDRRPGESHTPPPDGERR